MAAPGGTIETGDEAPRKPGIMAAIRVSRYARRIGLVALLLGFMLALSEVDALVAEREAMRGEAEAAVNALWAPPQQIVGPFLLVPSDRILGNGSALTVETRHHVLTPRELGIDIALTTETRRRGLFDIPVYTAEIVVTGRFDTKELAELLQRGTSPAPPLLAFTVSEARGIVDTPEAAWSGTPVAVSPELAVSAGPVLGDHTVAARLPAPDGDGGFRIAMRLLGTGRLLVAPSGRSTAVKMSASWPHPSFIGSRTARSHRISAKGFEAEWTVSPFGRSGPSQWTAGPPYEPNLVGAYADDAFGVALVQPVNPYRLTERALKYGMLFALYTFGAFLLLEIVFGVSLHWLHYALTGASVATFFLLLLSLSELVGFAAAYAIGASGVVLQTGLYARSVIGVRRLAIGFAGLLAGLYAGLYGLLQLADTALVVGSVSLFAAIGVAMLLTRRLSARSPVRT